MYLWLAFIGLILTAVFLIWISKNKPSKKDMNIQAQDYESISQTKNKIFIGQRGDGTKIRCIHWNDHFIYPPYGKEPEWIDLDQDHIKVNGFVIKKENARLTTYQCWSMHPNVIYVTSDMFNLYLEKISRF